MIILMLVKKVAYQLMAAGPVLLLALIAINSRMNVDDWEFIEYGPETSARIKAYREPVQAVRESFMHTQAYSEADIHRVIGVWIDEYDAGSLKDIHPETTVFEGATSAYQQILRARYKLVYRATETADSYKGSGRTEAAAYLYTDILEVANIAKFGDFASLADSAGTQADVLQKLITLAPTLTEVQRKEILFRIRKLDHHNRTLAHIVNRTSMAYRSDLRRQGRSTAIIEAARDSHTLASASDNLDEIRVDEWRLLSTADRALIPLYSRSRLAYLNEREYREVKKSAVQAFSPTEDTIVSSN